MLNQDETPLLYSLVFGEGVVNDATSVVLFNAIQNFDISHINSSIILQFVGSFLYLFFLSTVLGVVVSPLSLSCVCVCVFVSGRMVYDILFFPYVGWIALCIHHQKALFWQVSKMIAIVVKFDFFYWDLTNHVHFYILFFGR